MEAVEKPRMNWNALDQVKEWKRFKQHCQFVFDGPLAGKTEKVKVNYMMTWMGDKGREVYSSLTWAPAEGGNPAENETLQGVQNKFGAHVEPQTNNIRATVKFNNKKQTQTEKFDNFVTDLKLLVRDCAYADPDRMVRDAIVLRSHHDKVREYCLDKGDELTLDMAITIGRNHETSQESMRVINHGEDASVNAISRGRRSAQRPSYRNRDNRPATSDRRSTTSRRNPEARNPEARNRKCNKCGYNTHRKHESCPAKGKQCDFCNKPNHFASMCRKKNKSNMHQVEDEHEDEYDDEIDEENEYEDNDQYDEEDDMYLHSVYRVASGGSNTASDDEWYEDINVNGDPVNMQLDTGAKKCTIPYNIYQTLNPKPSMKRTNHKLEGYSGQRLNVKGTISVQLSYKDIECNAKLYVVEATSDKPPLLSGEMCQKLGLVVRVHTLQEDYPHLTTLTGTLPGTYTIKINPAATPVVHPPRRLPQALHERVKKKLQEMEQAHHIIRVHEPTDWVNSMVTVVKDDKVRICLDPKDLNKAVRREHYYIPTVEDVVASLPSEAQVFSTLDAKSGFLQIPIDYESSLLTTFNTPIGRYRWLRLPFGIKCAPEVFQQIMDNMLEGITGARAIMDDILIAAANIKEHDKIMKKVITRATEYNLKLNFDKCQIRQDSVKYVGHLVTARGLEADPDKLKAVAEMPAPCDKEGVRRFLGFIQYLAKFIPNLSEVDAPLRELIHKDTLFYWGKPQQESFDKLKELCTRQPVLKYYNPEQELTIQCDASSYGVGGVLLQEGQPIAYTSRSMTATEQRYAQIEKEMLAIVHSCKKFHHSIFGRAVNVESDHKPLQSIFKKPLLAAPMRLQTMLLRLQPYDLNVQYKPGTDIPLGDTLSRANLPDTEPDTKPIMVNMMQFISVTPTRYQDLQQRTANELNDLHSMILKGWPDTRSETPHSIREYWNHRDELSVSDGIVYKGMRIVVPPTLRPTMLQQVHESHLGIVKCKERAREVLFWPGMSQQIEDLVQDCDICQTFQNKQHSETLNPTPHPDLPWTEVASDIFDWKGSQYLLIVDYYSRYITVDKLEDMSSSSTIAVLKSQFCQHGIPETLRTDNGPQYSSEEFRQFCSNYQIIHSTSSPHFPQSNGEAERAVQTVKRLWKKCRDKQLALLDYRTTPLKSCNLSPAQLMFGRRPRNKLPAARSLLKPKLHDQQEIKRHFKKEKDNQTKYYNQKAGKDLPVLKPGDPVRMSPLPGTNQWRPATILKHHTSPRSYVVECQGRKYRRNRRDLRLSTHLANKASFATPPASLPQPSAVKVPKKSASSSSAESATSEQRPPSQQQKQQASMQPATPRQSPEKSARQQPSPRRQQEKKYSVKPAKNYEQNNGQSNPAKTNVYISKSGRHVKPPKVLDL